MAFLVKMQILSGFNSWAVSVRRGIFGVKELAEWALRDFGALAAALALIPTETKLKISNWSL